MTSIDKTQEVFDAGIAMTEKAAERLSAVMAVSYTHLTLPTTPYV